MVGNMDRQQVLIYRDALHHTWLVVLQLYISNEKYFTYFIQVIETAHASLSMALMVCKNNERTLYAITSYYILQHNIILHQLNLLVVIINDSNKITCYYVVVYNYDSFILSFRSSLCFCRSLPWTSGRSATENSCRPATMTMTAVSWCILKPCMHEMTQTVSYIKK